MLIAALAPLLAKLRLRLDLRAAENGEVQLTIVPEKTSSDAKTPAALLNPISICASPAEIDAELARGEAGALGQLFAQRLSLADQIAAQAAAEAQAAAHAAAQAKEKAKSKVAAKDKHTAKTPPAAAEDDEGAEAREPACDAPDSEAPAGSAAPASLW